MGHKLQLLKHTVAIWTMLSATILLLVVFLFSWPADTLSQMLWLIMLIFLANAILYGVGMWVWNVRIYLKSMEPEDKSEEEEWGV